MICISVQDRIDGHHRLVREGAKRINSAHKGYTIQALANELNEKEVDDLRKRRERNNHHLNRVYYAIPDEIPGYAVPDISSSHRFNVADTRSAIYIKSKDSLHLTASRCGCDVCITDSFLNCKVTKHQTHVFSMADIKSDRTYPEPSSLKSIPTAASESPSIENLNTDSKKSTVRSTRSSVKHSQDEIFQNETIDQPDLPSEIPKKGRKSDKIFVDREQIFRHSKTLKERITWISSARLQKLQCNLSPEEISLAKLEMEKMENSSRFNNHMGCFNDFLECPFRPTEEYELGDCDILCNRLRGSNRMSYMPPMQRGQDDSVDKTEVMNPSTLNSLIRLIVNGSFQTPDDLIHAAMDEFPGGLPSPNFESLTIVAFSTVGMKRNLRKGRFVHDNSAGHYLTLHLTMENSQVCIYDHLNEDFFKSGYFDFDLISKALQCLHDFYKKRRNEEPNLLEFIQHNVKKQTDCNCGPHAIANCELLIRKLDPAKQSFDKKIIAKIRSYHLLIKQCLINDFRLNLSSQ